MGKKKKRGAKALPFPAKHRMVVSPLNMKGEPLPKKLTSMEENNACNFNTIKME